MSDYDFDAVLPPFLAAAKRTFARYGVPKTTLEDIAAEAGVSRSTLYRAVGTKQQIIEAMVAAHHEAYLAEIDRLVPAGTPVPAALLVMARVGHDFRMHDPLGAPVLPDGAAVLLRIVGDPRIEASPYLLLADALGAVLRDRCPDVGRLRVTPEQAVELTTRLAVSGLLSQTSRFPDVWESLDRVIDGLGSDVPLR